MAVGFPLSRQAPQPEQTTQPPPANEVGPIPSPSPPNCWRPEPPSHRGQAIEVEVELDRGSDLAPHGLTGGASSHTSRQIRYVGRKAGARWFNHHGVGVTHRRRPPDCFSMLRRVPGASSSLDFPATVTLPGRIRCLNWRLQPLDHHTNLHLIRLFSPLARAAQERIWGHP